MGMAASQARYLGLTARKTNTEYEGQQINQARTALANQSANLWNQMLNMSVPIAPNKTDYVEQQYAFSDGSNEYEIDELQRADKEINGEKYNYQVTYHYNQDVYKGIQERNSNPQVQKITDYATNSITENNISVSKQNDSYNVTDSTGTTAQFKTCTQEDLEELNEVKLEEETQDESSNAQIRILTMYSKLIEGKSFSRDEMADEFGVSVVNRDGHVKISGDKPKVISTPVSPGVIYIHCTESQRRSILQSGSFIRHFVGNGTGNPKIIADSDMNEYIHQLDIRNEA